MTLLDAELIRSHVILRHVILVVGCFFMPFAMRSGKPILVVLTGSLIATCVIPLPFHKLKQLKALATTRKSYQFTMNDIVLAFTVAAIASCIFSNNLSSLSELSEKNAVRVTASFYLAVWLVLGIVASIAFHLTEQIQIRRAAISLAILSVLGISYGYFAFASAT